MPREEIAFTAWPKIQSKAQIFRYGQSIFCLPHRPNFSDIFDLCLHWVSVVRGSSYMWVLLAEQFQNSQLLWETLVKNNCELAVVVDMKMMIRVQLTIITIIISLPKFLPISKSCGELFLWNRALILNQPHSAPIWNPDRLSSFHRTDVQAYKK